MNVRPLIPVLLFGLAACSAMPTGETGAPTESSQPPATAQVITVSVADFMIEPSAFEVSGPAVSFEVTNDGPTPHNFTVRGPDDQVVMRSSDLAVGASETISASLEAGEYTVYCSLAGHESLGMTGTLTVEG